MTRSIQYLFFVAMIFAVPMVTGCGGSSEPSVVGANDTTSIEEEEEEAEAEVQPGDEGGPGGGGLGPDDA